MDDNARVRRISAVLLLFLVVSLLLSLPLVRGDEQRDRDRDVEGRGEHTEVVGGKQQPDPAERAIGIPGFMNRWDSVKTWAKLAWMNYRPPESWYKRGASSGEAVKEAAARSFESGKETVEKAAASAAQAAGDAVHKTKEKVKRTASMSAGKEADAEL